MTQISVKQLEKLCCEIESIPTSGWRRTFSLYSEHLYKLGHTIILNCRVRGRVLTFTNCYSGVDRSPVSQEFGGGYRYDTRDKYSLLVKDENTKKTPFFISEHIPCQECYSEFVEVSLPKNRKYRMLRDAFREIDQKVRETIKSQEKGKKRK